MAFLRRFLSSFSHCSRAPLHERATGPSGAGPSAMGAPPRRTCRPPGRPAGQKPGLEGAVRRRSTPIVLGNRLYLQDAADEGEKRQERVLCLNADTGKLLWEHRFNVYHSDVPPHRIGLGVARGRRDRPATSSRSAWAARCWRSIPRASCCGSARWWRTSASSPRTAGARCRPVLDGDLVIVSGIASGWGAGAWRAPLLRVRQEDGRDRLA